MLMVPKYGKILIRGSWSHQRPPLGKVKWIVEEWRKSLRRPVRVVQSKVCLLARSALLVGATGT